MKKIFLGLVLFLFFSQESALSQFQSKGGICTKGNCENGTGIKQWNDGMKYDGKWKEGKYNGKGVLSINYKGIDYIIIDAEWKNSEPHGPGIVYEYDVPASKETKYDKNIRDKIIGRFENGSLTGKVTAEYGSKCKFVGEYKKNENVSYQFQGIYTCPNEYKFEGDWNVFLERGSKGKVTCFTGKKETKNFIPDTSNNYKFNGNRWDHDKNKQCS